MSDYIDTRRGSVGPEARTRFNEAVRQLEAAETKSTTNITEAIAHANGAAMLAAQAQQLANDDVQAGQLQYQTRYSGGRQSNMGAMVGGIILGNILTGGMGGGMGGRRLDVDGLRRILRRRRRRTAGRRRAVLAIQPVSLALRNATTASSPTRCWVIASRSRTVTA